MHSSNTERVKSHKPVELIRGNDRFTAENLDYDNIDQVLELRGRVHGVLQPARRAMTRGGRPMDKLVFITGASSGIGQALAWRYHQAGWRLALAARRTGEIEAWANAQGIAADRYAIYGADVADTDSIVAAGQACLARQGVPDAVIANAGISIGVDTAAREDIDVIARTFATNNVGLAATFHPFVAAMAQRGSGALVGIASVAGIRGLPGHGAYCASKAAVISYCESLRGELRASGVKVVTICSAAMARAARALVGIASVAGIRGLPGMAPTARARPP